MQRIDQIIPTAAPQHNAATKRRSISMGLPPAAKTSNAASAISASPEALAAPAVSSPALAWRDSLESARELAREEHEQACEEAVAFRDAAYGRDRSALEKRIEAQAMSLCLENVPSNEILALMKTAIQRNPTAYPPKTPHLLRLFKGEEWVEDNGKVERVCVSNASAYEPLQPTENELIFKARLNNKADKPDPNQDPMTELTNRPQPIWRQNPETHPEVSDADILSALHLQCDMPAAFEATPDQKQAMLAFGRWWLQSERTPAWHPSAAHEKWTQWQTDQASFPEEPQCNEPP